ncbi:phospholipase A and acyltransferase 3-like isoform X2 [Mobula hypostoma]|uniref:phospholipase A and acyltransferase 3-like isoform X2 n=1 Tax=Mobula hypostoma TaxID=723540 RepID=UPI002FC398A5
MSSQKPSPDPQPGDSIEISRGIYQHWAIYIGDGDVVHLTSDGASVDVSYGYSSSTAIAVVKREPLAMVIGNDCWRINNDADRKWRPFPRHKIVERAKSEVGKKKRYQVLGANCEHFVNSVRYGKGLSYQVWKCAGGVLWSGLSILALPATAAAAASVGGFMVGYYIFDRILSK